MSTRATTSDDIELRAGDEEIGLHLLIMSPDSFTSLPLPKRGILRIGRSSHCHIHIDDPLASREHARLHVSEQLMVEDDGSANGTRVRDETIPAGVLVPINPGEGVAIGSTVLMVQVNRCHRGRQRLWSHAYFESRIETECARAQATGSTFAVARLHLRRPIPWTTLEPVFAREVPSPHLFGAYGPGDYEILISDGSVELAETLLHDVVDGLRRFDAEARTALAWFPRDGRTVDALIASANTLLRGEREPPVPGESPRSPALERTYELAMRAARASTNVLNILILGETGVGKGVVARAIHRASPRADKPFIALNCAGFSESTIESELFGHERGAFTGAGRVKPGLLETAGGGTVLLDEVGELPLAVQAKLLRVIETREVLRVGALKPRAIDVRFLAATNRDLEGEVLRGRFRRDLFFRLNGISLTVPPLRERQGEIGPLSRVFLAEACRRSNRVLPRVSPPAREILERYCWPGNVRELKNAVERALLLCDDEIRPDHLPIERMMAHAEQSANVAPPAPLPPAPADDRQRIIDALAYWGGNPTRAVKSLGMPRRTFIAKLDRYGFPRPRKRPRRRDPDKS